MLQNYKNLSDSLDPSLDTLDALTAISFDLERQSQVVRQEYWQLMRDIDARFSVDIMAATHELESES